MIWRVIGPSGPMETSAPTRAKAESNIRYRLNKVYHLSVYAAQQYDLSDLHPKTPEESGSQYEGRQLTK